MRGDLLRRVRFISRYYGEGETIEPTALKKDDEGGFAALVKASSDDALTKQTGGDLHAMPLADLEARYGAGIPMAGPYSGRLSNFGETVELLRPGCIVSIPLDNLAEPAACLADRHRCGAVLLE